MNKLIIASNRLPISVGKTIRRSSGGLVAALQGLQDDTEMSWVGWSGNAVSDPNKREELRQTLRDEYGCHPVFLSRKEVADYYNGYSNASLWPLLHYWPSYSHYEERWHDVYHQVNSYFADVICEQAESGDMVWIQDYHLMYLPSMLQQRRSDLKIGFFLHTPFPSYEIFRCHPNREALLQGLLGADLLGFHTYGYLRHFRSTALRLLGLESDIDHLDVDGHRVNLGVYPIGINAKGFLETLQDKKYHKKREEFRKLYEGKKVVLSVERLDYSKGIPRRLDAIERFLAQYKGSEPVVFVFISVPSRNEVSEYQELRETVEQKVSKINGQYSTITNIPIHFIYQSVAFPDLCALYSIADVALVTPLIDGMNLVAKEFIACKPDLDGVLILSEFAGAAEELFHAIHVNPYNIHEVADALNEALTATSAQKKRHLERMRQRVLKHDAVYWANSFVRQLQGVGKTQSVRTSEPRPEPTELLGRPEEHTAVFLDYDGTLSEIRRDPDAARPQGQITELLETLAQTPNIRTHIISGRKTADLEQWLASYPFTLIAEHGFFYRRPDEDEWFMIDPLADLSWKQQIRDIMENWVDNTPGSMVEEKTSSVVWHYRRADPEFGNVRAQQLLSELHEMLSNVPVVVHHGRKIVEVSSTQVNKGAAMATFIDSEDDRVLCIGDDETDETMFAVNDPRLVSVKIGTAPTQAQYSLPNPATLRYRLLQECRERIGK